MTGKKTVLISLVALVLLSLAGSRLQQASAASPSPRPVLVDIYVASVGTVDQQAGSFEADFYLSFEWNGTWYGSEGNQSAAFPQDFAILNGQVSQLELVDSEPNINGTGENYLSYRVYATLYAQMNFARYPLDRQTLSIEVENNDYDNSSLVFVADTQSQLSPSAQVPGWSLQRGSEKLSVVNDVYHTSFGYPGSPAGAKYSYSEAVFSFSVRRPYADTAMNVVLPIGVLVALAMVTFRIRPESFDIRLEVGVISVFTAVAFLLALSNGLPAQDYLTLGDQLMIVAFAILIYAIALTMVLHGYGESGVPRWAERLNAASFYLVPVVAALAVVILVEV